MTEFRIIDGLGEELCFTNSITELLHYKFVYEQEEKVFTEIKVNGEWTIFRIGE